MLLKVFFLHSYCMYIKNNMYIYLGLFKPKIRTLALEHVTSCCGLTAIRWQQNLKLFH